MTAHCQEKFDTSSKGGIFQSCKTIDEAGPAGRVAITEAAHRAAILAGARATSGHEAERGPASDPMIEVSE
jgi:hypothetical protein